VTFVRPIQLAGAAYQHIILQAVAGNAIFVRLTNRMAHFYNCVTDEWWISKSKVVEGCSRRRYDLKEAKVFREFVNIIVRDWGDAVALGAINFRSAVGLEEHQFAYTI
jgi:hypothetical protein